MSGFLGFHATTIELKGGVWIGKDDLNRGRRFFHRLLASSEEATAHYGFLVLIMRLPKFMASPIKRKKKSNLWLAQHLIRLAPLRYSSPGGYPRKKTRPLIACPFIRGLVFLGSPSCLDSSFSSWGITKGRNQSASSFLHRLA